MKKNITILSMLFGVVATLTTGCSTIGEKCKSDKECALKVPSEYNCFPGGISKNNKLPKKGIRWQ